MAETYNDIRTRIAAVLRGYLLDHFIVDMEQAQGLWPEYLADAVIRELRCRQEAAFDRQSGKLLRHRYVTEWETEGDQ